MPEHDALAGVELHVPFHYIQPADPGAVGAGKWWADTTANLVKQRNAGNSAWVTFGSGGGGGAGSYVTPPPVNATSTGTAGQYSADANAFYICYATDLWKKTNLLAFGSSTLTFVSNGDVNGACYFIGTNFGAVAWTNPHTSGRIVALMSSIGFGAAGDLVDRATNDTFTSDAVNSWMGIDLGAGVTITPNHYSIRGRTGTNLPRNWKLQGTNFVSAITVAGFDGATWTDLNTQTANATIAASNDWASQAVVGAGAYRYLRVLQTGANSNGDNFFCMAEFEFYGTLTF